VTLARRIDPKSIRKEIQSLATELHEMRDKADKKLVRLSNLVATVSELKLFREWKHPKTGKNYKTFDSWLGAEVRESRSSVYRFIGVRQYLKSLPDSKLEEIGIMRCFELVKIAREQPTMLPRFLKEIEKNPQLEVVTLKAMVSNTLAGGEFDSGEYESIEFVVKKEDAPYVHKALAVMQAVEAVANPDAPSGRGVHLVSLCQEYLSGREQVAILKNLEEAGAFNKAAWKIEE
jgi:hypothetical protein